MRFFTAIGVLSFSSLACGPNVSLPGGEGAGDSASGTGSPAGSSTDAASSDGGDASSGGVTMTTGTGGGEADASTGSPDCACDLDGFELQASFSYVVSDDTSVQSIITEAGVAWVRSESPTEGNYLARHPMGNEESGVWSDQQLALHAPVLLAAAAQGASLGEYVPLEDTWRFQVFDNAGLRQCYVDRPSALLPTQPPASGGWAFLQPGQTASLLPPSCDEAQLETVPLTGLVPILGTHTILDAAWTSDTLAVTGYETSGEGEHPRWTALERASGDMTLDWLGPPVRGAWSWTLRESRVYLTDVYDDVVDVVQIDPATGTPTATTLELPQDATFTAATVLHDATDPWLLLDGPNPWIMRLNDDGCCAVPLPQEDVSEVHASHRNGNAIRLVATIEEAGSHRLHTLDFAAP